MLNINDFPNIGETKATIEIKDGRYGSYITDGKINVTIPKTSAAAIKPTPKSPATIPVLR